MPPLFGIGVAQSSGWLQILKTVVNFVVRRVFIKPKRLFKMSLPSPASSAKIDLD
jgi:hypothetical protein